MFHLMAQTHSYRVPLATPPVTVHLLAPLAPADHSLLPRLSQPPQDVLLVLQVSTAWREPALLLLVLMVKRHYHRLHQVAAASHVKQGSSAKMVSQLPALPAPTLSVANLPAPCVPEALTPPKLPLRLPLTVRAV